MASPRAVFNLGEALALAHERSAPGHVTVIPVIVDDLVPALPVLRALCEVAEGRMFDASDPSLQSTVPVTTDVVRRTAIETALSGGEGAAARRVVLFEPEPGQVDARYDPSTGAEPSAGERAVLAVARAAAHRELDERELAVITYSESGIDLPFRRRLWSLAVDQLSDLPHSTLRTLVFVTEAKIDIDVHCQTGRGFRLALRESRLLRRQTRDDLRVAAHKIANHPGCAVFFLGAGFGASSKLPLGNTLRDTAIRRLLNIPEAELISSKALGVRFHQWVSAHDRWLTEGELAMREDDRSLSTRMRQSGLEFSE